MYKHVQSGENKLQPTPTGVTHWSNKLQQTSLLEFVGVCLCGVNWPLGACVYYALCVLQVCVSHLTNLQAVHMNRNIPMNLNIFFCSLKLEYESVWITLELAPRLSLVSPKVFFSILSQKEFWFLAAVASGLLSWGHLISSDYRQLDFTDTI